MIETAIATWTTALIAGILSLHACPARCGARRRCGTAKLCSAPCLPLATGTLPCHPPQRQAAHATHRGITPDDMPAPIQQLRASPSLRGVSRHTFGQFAPEKRGSGQPATGLQTVHRELRCPGVPLLLLWEEYRAAHGGVETAAM